MFDFSVSFIPVCLVLLSCQANATDFGHGRVSMAGEIVDSACSVNTGSPDQTIDMLSQPVSEIVSENSGLSRPFSIKLENCSLERYSSKDQPIDNYQYFQITFDGQRDDDAFGIDGEAQGVALQIRDANGNAAIPGQPLPADNIQQGSMVLNYTMRLIGDGDELQPGAYHSTIRYKLDYY